MKHFKSMKQLWTILVNVPVSLKANMHILLVSVCVCILNCWYFLRNKHIGLSQPRPSSGRTDHCVLHQKNHLNASNVDNVVQWTDWREQRQIHMYRDLLYDYGDHELWWGKAWSFQLVVWINWTSIWEEMKLDL